MNLDSIDEVPNLNEILSQLNAYNTDEIEFVTTPSGPGLLLIGSQLKFHTTRLYVPDYNNKLISRFLTEGIKSLEYDNLPFVDEPGRKNSCFRDIDKNEFEMLKYNISHSTTVNNNNPDINARDRLVLVFVNDLGLDLVDNIQTSSEILFVQWRNSRNLTPTRSRKPLINRGINKLKERDFYTIYKFVGDKIRGKNRGEIDINKDLLKPHLFWRDMVNRYQERPSLHIRAPEDHDQITHPPEGPFDKEILLSDFLEGGYKNVFDTAVFHILIGKNNTESESTRINKFKYALEKALNIFHKTVITEYNKSSDQFREHHSVVSFAELEEIIARDMDFDKRIVESRKIPGNGKKNRNTLVVLE